MVFPTCKPVLFNSVPHRIRHIAFHVAFEADSSGKHVAVFCHVAHPFASRALNIRKEGSTVAVRTGQAAWIGRCALTFPWSTCGSGTSTGPKISVGVAAAISVFEANAGAIVTIDTVDRRDTLHDGAEASYSWGYNVTHARLHILVNAGSQTVDS
jgi:hypothetical protein